MSTKRKDEEWLAVEKDVHRIQVLLNPGKEVSHNVRVPDKDSGQLRQIDIVVRDPSALPVERASECRHHSERQGSPWVEQAQGKKRSIQADKMTLVSTSGFTDPAQVKANALTAEGTSIELMVCQDVGDPELLQRFHPKPIQVRFLEKLKLLTELATLPPKLPFPEGYDPKSIHFVNSRYDGQMWPEDVLLYILRKNQDFHGQPKNKEYNFSVKLVEDAVATLRAHAPGIDWALRGVTFTGSLLFKEIEIPFPSRIRYYRRNESSEILAAIARFEFTLGATPGHFEMVHLPNSVAEIQLCTVPQLEVTFSPVEWTTLTANVPSLYERDNKSVGSKIAKR